MTLTYRRNKTTQLTPDEADANLDHLSLSSNHSFTQSGTGASTRTVQAKLRDVVSVKDFGATGDGSTDDTTAIQAAIDAVLTVNGGGLYFPDGTYKISSALTFGQLGGNRIFGQSRYGTIIKQNTSNTAIFQFNVCTSADFEISSLHFTWTNAQTSSNTSSIALYFSGTSGDVGAGFFNFHITDCLFSKGFRSFAGNTSAGLAVWGWEISHCTHASTMVGAFCHVVPSPSIGIPNAAITHCYILANSASEPLINLSSFGEVTLKNVEINNGTIGGTGNPTSHMLFTSCANVNIINCREESFTLSANNLQAWNFSATKAEIIGAHFGSMSVDAALLGHCITANSTSKVSVHGLTASLGTIGGGASTSMFNGTGFGVLADFSWEGGNGTYHLYATATADRVQVSERVSADNGDAAKTLTAGPGQSDLTQVWNTPLTADRAVTLTTTALRVWNGAEFRIVRTAAATGASNLNVGTGPLKALAVGQWCVVRHNGTAWALHEFGSL